MSQAIFPGGGSVGRIGAGDSFTAGVLFRYLQRDGGDWLPDALRWGAAAAAIKYTIPGDMGLFELKEVAALVASGRLPRRCPSIDRRLAVPEKNIQNYYQILGVNRNATQEVLDAAYRRQVRLHTGEQLNDVALVAGTEPSDPFWPAWMRPIASFPIL